MKEFFNSKSFKILLAVIFILSGIAIMNYYDTFNIAESAISFVVTPMQKLVTKISESASNIVKGENSKEEYERQINELKSEIVNLRTLLVDYSNLKTQNEQYSQYLKLKQENESLQFVPAEVIARDPNEDFYGFTISKGSSSGISVNDPVITSNGVVGCVSFVDLTSSHVKTLLSPETKVGAINKITRDSGVVTGNIKLAEQNCSRLSYISAQSVMSPGDIVVTTGLGGIYPRDLQIGKVKELFNDEYDSSRYAVIELFEDVRTVRDVFVVTGFEGKGTISNKPVSEVFKNESSESSKSEE